MINVSPLSGYKYLTDFTAIISPSSNDIVINWGDGTFSNSATATHNYTESNYYTVYAGTCSTNTSAFLLSVYNGPFLENNIYVTSDTITGIAGCSNYFNISLSAKNELSTIHLYSSGSNSLPYNNNRTFWSHLNPEWRFKDANSNIVASIELTGSPVYYNTTIIGYTANSTVNYIDDMPGTPNLFFTVQSDPYINSRAFAALPYQLISDTPQKLLITADGINDINTIQWGDKPITYVISVQGNCSNIIHNASGSILGNKVINGCYGLDSFQYQFSAQNMNLITDCYNTGGYVINTLTVPQSALPDSTKYDNFDITCGVNPAELEIQQYRTTPQQVTLSAVAQIYVNNIPYTLTGISNNFNIYKFENFHQFYRKGEDKTIYDLVRKYNHFDLDVLPTYDLYLNAIAGSGDSLGKMYDKIVNLPKDVADVDLCTLDSLYDMANKYDAPIDSFNVAFPEELRRLMDLFSIPLQKLIGTRCVCNTNFNCNNCCGKNICSVCGFDKRSNVGIQLTKTDYVSAGQIIIMKEHGSDTFEFIPIYTSSLLKDLNNEYITTKGIDNFCFYTWDKSAQGNPVESVIDYKNPNTLLSRSLSSTEEFYGNNGVLEETLNYILTKNLL